MALISCQFRSKQLQMATQFLAILPENVEGAYRSVYLLHGHSDDYSAWTRYTSIERYASERGLAIFMPSAEHSFYCDMDKGLPYYSFLMEEFLPYTRKLFQLSTRREDTFVAGLSMGGYGAFRLALRCPEIFAAGASFSGAVDVAELAESGMRGSNLAELIWKDPMKVRGSEDDLFTLVEKLKNCPVKPRLYQECGTEDFLYADNIRFRDFVQKTDFDYRYVERPGVHNWEFWDGCIPKALDFFLEK